LGNQKLFEKKPLLAPIQQHKEGYFVSIGFSLNEEKLSNLESKCKQTEHLLRFMLMKEVKKDQKQKQKLPLEPVVPQKTLVSAEEEQKKEEKIDLKDIDEKLEEIFKES